ncbi:hypothetical protein ACMFMG_010632 [Clarireedia jacksonii]
MSNTLEAVDVHLYLQGEHEMVDYRAEKAIEDVEHTGSKGTCSHCQGRSDWDFLGAFYKRTEDAEERAKILAAHLTDTSQKLTDTCEALEWSYDSLRYREDELNRMKGVSANVQSQHRVTLELLDHEITHHKDTVATLDFYIQKYNQVQKCYDIVSENAKQSLVIIDNQREKIIKLKAALSRALRKRPHSPRSMANQALAEDTDETMDTDDDTEPETKEEIQPSRTIITER